MVQEIYAGELKACPCALRIAELMLFPLSQPIFVASGTDYILKTGTNPGGLGRTLLSEIRGRRIREASNAVEAGFSSTNSPADNINVVLSERDARDEQREIEGGIVLLGRGALKEYLWALKRGYGETIDLREEARLEGLGLSANERRKDGRWEREEEIMSRELEREDAVAERPPFEEDLPVGLQGLSEDDSAPVAAASNPLSYTPYRSIIPADLPKSAPAAASSSDTEPKLLPPPSTLPPQPPLLLVPFTHPFGIQRWPSKLVHFFNKRSDVRLGGEYALAAIVSHTRPFLPPTIRDPATAAPQGLLDEKLVAEVRVGEHKDLVHEEGVRTGSPDLDFLAETDEDPYWFRRTYRKLPSAHEYSKRTFYKDELPGKLKTARELANGREPTKAELNYPPKLESDLRKERLDKELKWRRELEGWAVVRAGSGIAWDEKWGFGEGAETPLSVFTLPTEDDKRRLTEQATAWDMESRRREADLEERLRSMPTAAPEQDE